MIRIILIAIVSFLCSCAGTSVSIPNVSDAEMQEAYKQIPSESGRATVCIFRDVRFVNGGARPDIYMNADEWGVLPNDSFLCNTFEPAEYVISASGYGYGHSLNLSLQPDTVTYLFYNTSSLMIMPSNEDVAVKNIANIIKHQKTPPRR